MISGIQTENFIINSLSQKIIHRLQFKLEIIYDFQFVQEIISNLQFQTKFMSNLQLNQGYTNAKCQFKPEKLHLYNNRFTQEKIWAMQ